MESLDLISLIEMRPAVWNKKDPFHCNRAYVDKCWKDVSAKLKMDEFKVRKKWKYLRDQYRVELGKVKEAPMYNPKWPYFKALSFLREVLKPTKRAPTGTAATENDAVSDEDEESIDSHTSLTVKNPRSLGQENQDGHFHENEPYPQQTRLRDEDDEHLHFFKSLLSHVRKIPDHRQLSFRTRIQEVVNDFVYGSKAENPPDIQCLTATKQDMP